MTKTNGEKERGIVKKIGNLDTEILLLGRHFDIMRILLQREIRIEDINERRPI